MRGSAHEAWFGDSWRGHIQMAILDVEVEVAAALAEAEARLEGDDDEQD